MARDGNGNYNLPTGNPVVTATTISSSVENTTMSDIATALTGSIAADGQTTPSANLKMGGFKHTNVAVATSRIGSAANYATAADVQDGTITHLTGVAGTNTITASAPLGLAAYVTGQKFTFIPAVTNTGATTLNVNSIGAKNVFLNAAALSGGELVISSPVEVLYDGTQFNLIGNSAFVAVTDSSAIVKGSADATKKVRMEVDGLTTATTRVMTVPDRDITINTLTSIAASLGADVALNNQTLYFDGPSVAQGTTGTWFASGTITVADTAGPASILCKLWDGTTVIASAVGRVPAASATTTISLSGVISNPAGNIRISARDTTSATGTINFNLSSNNKDSTITAVRIA